MGSYMEAKIAEPYFTLYGGSEKDPYMAKYVEKLVIELANSPHNKNIKNPAKYKEQIRFYKFVKAESTKKALENHIFINSDKNMGPCVVSIKWKEENCSQ